MADLAQQLRKRRHCWGLDRQVFPVLVVGLQRLFLEKIKNSTVRINCFTQSELTEPVLPPAAQQGIHFYLYLSLHTVRDVPP